RYRAAPAGPAAVAPAAERTSPDASVGTGDGARAGDAQAGAIAAPAALAGVDTGGSVRIGALKVAGVDAGNVVATIGSGNGRVELKRLTAAVFRGTLDASATLGEAGRHALRLKLTGADAGMALRELAGRDVLDGRGDLSLDVTANGRTLAALERSLDGTAALALRDGALKGVDLADVLRRVRQALAVARGSGSAIEQSAGGDERTAFSSLDASFVIRDGVARNDDLDLRSPLLRVSGAGRIDLPNRTVDYLARVSVVGTLAGQGGAELAALRGVTVPVELKGPFESMSYRVDVAGLAIDTAKQALTRKLQEKLLGKPDAGAKEPSKPISPRDLLEGLMRRRTRVPAVRGRCERSVRRRRRAASRRRPARTRCRARVASSRRRRPTARPRPGAPAARRARRRRSTRARRRRSRRGSGRRGHRARRARPVRATPCRRRRQ